jgi:hypothetical protein
MCVQFKQQRAQFVVALVEVSYAKALFFSRSRSSQASFEVGLCYIWSGAQKERAYRVVLLDTAGSGTIELFGDGLRQHRETDGSALLECSW